MHIALDLFIDADFLVLGWESLLESEQGTNTPLSLETEAKLFPNAKHGFWLFATKGPRRMDPFLFCTECLFGDNYLICEMMIDFKFLRVLSFLPPCQPLYGSVTSFLRIPEVPPCSAVLENHVLLKQAVCSHTLHSHPFLPCMFLFQWVDSHLVEIIDSWFRYEKVCVGNGIYYCPYQMEGTSVQERKSRQLPLPTELFQEMLWLLESTFGCQEERRGWNILFCMYTCSFLESWIMLNAPSIPLMHFRILQKNIVAFKEDTTPRAHKDFHSLHWKNKESSACTSQGLNGHLWRCMYINRTCVIEAEISGQTSPPTVPGGSGIFQDTK